MITFICLYYYHNINTKENWFTFAGRGKEIFKIVAFP